MYANHRHYILFVLAFIAFVVSTLGFYFLRQQIYHQAVLGADLTKQVAAMEDEEKHERDVNNVYAKLNAEKVVLKNAVVTKEGVVDFIETFEKIGSDTGTEVELSRIDNPEVVKTTKIEDNFGHLKAHAEVMGTWEGVMKALVLIEHIPYSVAFNNIHLSEETPVKVETVENASTTVNTKPTISKRVWHLTMDLSVLMTPL